MVGANLRAMNNTPNLPNASIAAALVEHGFDAVSVWIELTQIGTVSTSRFGWARTFTPSLESIAVGDALLVRGKHIRKQVVGRNCVAHGRRDAPALFRRHATLAPVVDVLRPHVETGSEPGHAAGDFDCTVESGHGTDYKHVVSILQRQMETPRFQVSTARAAATFCQ